MRNAVETKDQIFGLVVALLLAAIIIPLYLGLEESEFKTQLANFGTGGASSHNPEFENIEYDLFNIEPNKGFADIESFEVKPMYQAAGRSGTMTFPTSVHSNKSVMAEILTPDYNPKITSYRAQHICASPIVTDVEKLKHYFEDLQFVEVSFSEKVAQVAVDKPSKVLSKKDLDAICSMDPKRIEFSVFNSTNVKFDTVLEQNGLKSIPQARPVGSAQEVENSLRESIFLWAN